MSIEILEEKDYGRAVLIHTAGPDFAFGPVLKSAEEARAFLKWLLLDPREYTDPILAAKLEDFRHRKTKPCPLCGDEIDADAARCADCDEFGG